MAIVGRKVNPESVKNVTTLADYLHSRYGLARPASVKDKSLDKKALDWFWENYPNATWQDLCRLADHVFKSKQYRPKHIYGLITYNAREAWAEGVLKPQDPGLRSLEQKITECVEQTNSLDVDAKEYWTMRFTHAVGPGRAVVYNEFNRWMKENM